MCSQEWVIHMHTCLGWGHKTPIILKSSSMTLGWHLSPIVHLAICLLFSTTALVTVTLKRHSVCSLQLVHKQASFPGNSVSVTVFKETVSWTWWKVCLEVKVKTLWKANGGDGNIPSILEDLILLKETIYFLEVCTWLSTCLKHLENFNLSLKKENRRSVEWCGIWT